MSLLEKMKQIHCRDENHELMNCAMIDCSIHITDFGKLINFKRFTCFSYSENWGGLAGLMIDKENDMMFHFSATQRYIMIYPVKNDNYKPQSFIDFFEWIKKKIDKNAELLTYQEYQEKHKKEDG